MKQKIKDFLEKMTGMQIIIFQVFYVIILTNIVHIVTYRIAGDMEVAVLVAIAVAFAALSTFTVAFPATTTDTLAAFAALSTFTVAFPATTTDTLAALVALATLAVFAVIAVAFAAVDVVEKYKIKYWKVFSVYLVEATLLYLSFTYLVPYSTIIVLCFSLLGISYFVSMHYLKTYLVENPPSEKPRSTKRVDYYGNHLMRLASVTTEIPPLPEPLKTKAYRFVHERLI